MLTVIAGVAYTVAFARSGNRLGVGVMVALMAVVGTLVLWVVPWRQVIASSQREIWFLCWSVLTLVSITVMAGIDGGATSPLALALCVTALPDRGSLLVSYRPICRLGRRRLPESGPSRTGRKGAPAGPGLQYQDLVGFSPHR